MNWIKRLFTTNPPAQPKPKETAAAVDALTPEALRERYRSLYRPAVQLRPAPTSAFSRLGGLPDLPAGMEWPQWKDKPQSFLAQLDLAEIHQAMPSCLPSTGCLYFFYDQEQGVWGFDPKDIGGWRVLYSIENPSGFSKRDAPAGLPEECIFKSKPVAAHAIELLPDSQSLPAPKLQWDTDGETFQKLRTEVFGGFHHHQVLGYPTPVQNDDMELECQLASNGIYVGDSKGYQDPRVEGLKATATDWKLLLQLDTDDDTGWMWGDVGTLYFWVREQDARQCDFSKVWIVFQCC